jgi:hypothetical protein
MKTFYALLPFVLAASVSPYPVEIPEGITARNGPVFQNFPSKTNCPESKQRPNPPLIRIRIVLTLSQKKKQPTPPTKPSLSPKLSSRPTPRTGLASISARAPTPRTIPGTPITRRTPRSRNAARRSPPRTASSARGFRCGSCLSVRTERPGSRWAANRDSTG